VNVGKFRFLWESNQGTFWKTLSFIQVCEFPGTRKLEQKLFCLIFFSHRAHQARKNSKTFRLVKVEFQDPMSWGNLIIRKEGKAVSVFMFQILVSSTSVGNCRAL
jgi:hypothetical protein